MKLVTIVAGAARRRSPGGTVTRLLMLPVERQAQPTPTGGRHMTVNEGLRAAAGTFILLSVALGIWVNPWFFAFTAFVGLNLLQSAFSRWCPMMWVLGKAGCRAD